MSENFPYRIDDAGIHYAHSNHEHLLGWQDVRGLRKSLFSSKHYIKGLGHRLSLPAGSESFVDLFFRTWEKQFPAEAKKGAFDYAFPNRTFAGLVLATCFLFAFPIAAVLMVDSREQLACTKQLEAGSVATQATITKAKKKRKGHYVLFLTFTAPDGTLIEGRDQFITEDNSNPPGSIPVVYAKENPRCWTTPSSANTTEVNWAKRRYFTAITGMFSVFLLISGLAGIIFGMLRLREKRPYAGLLKKHFSLS